MKYLSEEVAYLRGLAEGLEIESETKEGKMICKIIDVLENLADTLDDMQQDYDELVEYVESVDEDLSDVEDILYEEDSLPSVYDYPNYYLSSIGYNTIPADMYFVLGDNREDSLDSREIGLINKDDINGKISFRFWPLNKLKFY